MQRPENHRNRPTPLPAPHIYQPLARETVGPVNSTCKVGRKLSGVSGDWRETMLLFQQIWRRGALQFGSVQGYLLQSEVD